MLIGYMRVSTLDQNLDLQRDALAAARCEQVYEDTCSGSATSRPGLDLVLRVLRAGDTLVVWKLDRIGRNLKHVVTLIDELQGRGVGFRVLTGEIDTMHSAGRLILNIFASLAEFERDLIQERTLAGLAAARARGRLGGRPRRMTRDKLRAAMALMADRESVAKSVAEELGVSVSTLYEHVDGRGVAKEKGRALLSASRRAGNAVSDQPPEPARAES